MAVEVEFWCNRYYLISWQSAGSDSMPVRKRQVPNRAIRSLSILPRRWALRRDLFRSHRSGALQLEQCHLQNTSCKCLLVHANIHMSKSRDQVQTLNLEYSYGVIRISLFFFFFYFLREKINFCPSTRGHVVCLGVTMWHRHDTVVLEAGIYSMGYAAEIIKKHHTTQCRVSRHDSCNCAAKPARSIVGWCTEYSVNPSDLPSLQHLHHTP